MLNPCVKFTKPFIVEPELITFANYERDKTYVKKITIKNNDSVSFHRSC